MYRMKLRLIKCSGWDLGPAVPVNRHKAMAKQKVCIKRRDLIKVLNIKEKTKFSFITNTFRVMFDRVPSLPDYTYEAAGFLCIVSK